MSPVQFLSQLVFRCESSRNVPQGFTQNPHESWPGKYWSWIMLSAGSADKFQALTFPMIILCVYFQGVVYRVAHKQSIRESITPECTLHLPFSPQSVFSWLSYQKSYILSQNIFVKVKMSFTFIGQALQVPWLPPLQPAKYVTSPKLPQCVQNSPWWKLIKNDR